MANEQKSESGLFAGPGEYEADAFDLDVLRLLPDEGTKKGKYMQDAMSVRQVKRALDPTLKPGFIATRMKRLRDEGLVISMTLIGETKHGLGWQRTEKGRQLATAGTLAEREANA